MNNRLVTIEIPGRRSCNANVETAARRAGHTQSADLMEKLLTTRELANQAAHCAVM